MMASRDLSFYTISKCFLERTEVEKAAAQGPPKGKQQR